MTTPFKYEHSRQIRNRNGYVGIQWKAMIVFKWQVGGRVIIRKRRVCFTYHSGLFEQKWKAFSLVFVSINDLKTLIQITQRGSQSKTWCKRLPSKPTFESKPYCLAVLYFFCQFWHRPGWLHLPRLGVPSLLSLIL